MATATLPFITVEEYVHSVFRPDVDYVDGHIEERNLGEMDHADLQTILATIFRVHQKAWKVKAFTELRVQVAATRFRIPDITVVDSALPRSPIVHEAPMLCLEVLSPDDRVSGMIKRSQDYFAMGVPEVWIFDPEKRTALVLLRDGTQSEHREGSLKLAGTAIEIELAEVFAVLDEA